LVETQDVETKGYLTTGYSLQTSGLDTPFTEDVQGYSTSGFTGNGSDYETMVTEKFGKDLTPHRVKYRTVKR